MGLSKALSPRFFSTFSLQREHGARGGFTTKAAPNDTGPARAWHGGSRSPEGPVLGEDAGPAARLPGLAQPPRPEAPGVNEAEGARRVLAGDEAEVGMAGQPGDGAQPEQARHAEAEDEGLGRAGAQRGQRQPQLLAAGRRPDAVGLAAERHLRPPAHRRALHAAREHQPAARLVDVATGQVQLRALRHFLLRLGATAPALEGARRPEAPPTGHAGSCSPAGGARRIVAPPISPAGHAGSCSPAHARPRGTPGVVVPPAPPGGRSGTRPVTATGAFISASTPPQGLALRDGGEKLPPASCCPPPAPHRRVFISAWACFSSAGQGGQCEARGDDRPPTKAGVPAAGLTCQQHPEFVRREGEGCRAVAQAKAQVHEGLIHLPQLAGAEGVIHPPAHRARPADCGRGLSTPQVPGEPPATSRPRTHASGCRPSGSPASSSASPRRSGTARRRALRSGGETRGETHRAPGRTPEEQPPPRGKGPVPLHLPLGSPSCCSSLASDSLSTLCLAALERMKPRTAMVAFTSPDSVGKMVGRLPPPPLLSQGPGSGGAAAAVLTQLGVRCQLEDPLVLRESRAGAESVDSHATQH